MGRASIEALAQAQLSLYGSKSKPVEVMERVEERRAILNTDALYI